MEDPSGGEAPFECPVTFASSRFGTERIPEICNKTEELHQILGRYLPLDTSGSTHFGSSLSRIRQQGLAGSILGPSPTSQSIPQDKEIVEVMPEETEDTIQRQDNSAPHISPGRSMDSQPQSHSRTSQHVDDCSQLPSVDENISTSADDPAHRDMTIVQLLLGSLAIAALMNFLIGTSIGNSSAVHPSQRFLCLLL
jgi:hypothetical protein